MGCERSRLSRGSAPLALLAIAAALAACDGGTEPSLASDRVERIVLVTIDTLRADHVGCYGAAAAETPALDALAAEGVRFETAISPTPLTLPSHATLLTGRDPPSHGVRHNGLFRLPPDVVPLAEHLRAAGFATAGFVSTFVLDGRFGLDRGFDHYDDALGMLTASTTARSSRRGDHTVDAALGWLEGAPDRFFLWVHLYDPHAPYAPPEPFASRFTGRPYDGEIAFADAQLGRLRTALAQRWSGGTLWWITSDHGESLGEHQEATHSYGIYEATQRVPLIVAGPGLPQGGVVTGVAGLADAAPTLLELAALPPLPGAGGHSLAPALRNGGGSPRAAAWVETLATQLDMGWSPLLGVRTSTHKYIRAPEPELYDLASDPAELENLAALRPELVAELDRVVEEQTLAARPVASTRTLDAEERARLEALGYLQGGAKTRPEATLGRVGGPDPKREVAALAQLEALVQLLEQRRGAEALAAYERIPRPGYPIVMLGVNAALMANDFERAEREARVALSLAEEAEPWIAIAKTQVAAERLDEARQSLERARGLDPEEPEVWLGLGHLAEQEGRSEEALRLYEHARSLPLVSPEALWRIAALQLEAGRRHEARELLVQVPQSELRVPEAAARLARAERAAGRPQLARTRVDGALRDHPNDPDLWALKAELLDREGDLRAALAARRNALRLAPDRPDLQNVVAWTLGRMGRNLAEADALASRAIAKLGRKPALLDTLATVRTAQGRFAESLALADEGLAAASAGDRVDLAFRRAEALAGLGRHEEAEAALALARQEAGAQKSAWNTWPEAERRVRRLLAPSS
jgi:arylsulfatase A-like enzyme/tetratricopeptide (TPR) repeat protein